MQVCALGTTHLSFVSITEGTLVKFVLIASNFSQKDNMISFQLNSLVIAFMAFVVTKNISEGNYC